MTLSINKKTYEAGELIAYVKELEEKISVLLSCKNCPENKGGLICQKEYEDKCLAQKIQYIKELQEENENLKKTYRKQRNKRIDELQKENAELKKKYVKNITDCDICDIYCNSQLIKAKEYIKLLLMNCVGVYESTGKTIAEIQAEAEQFLNSEVEE